MAGLYANTEDNLSRFVLGTGGISPLVCIGLNPSTAEPGKLDQTLSSVERVASRHGHDGFLMLNVYPLRATRPKDLPAEYDPNLKRENERQIAAVINGRELPVWAAWGSFISKRPYFAQLLLDLLDLPQLEQCNWYSRGPTGQDGHPHHPLYVNEAEPFGRFDLDSYRMSLRR